MLLVNRAFSVVLFIPKTSQSLAGVPVVEIWIVLVGSIKFLSKVFYTKKLANYIMPRDGEIPRR